MKPGVQKSFHGSFWCSVDQLPSRKLSLYLATCIVWWCPLLHTFTSGTTFAFVYIYLTSRKTQRVRQWEVFSPLVYYPNAYNCWYWATLKTGVRNSIYVFHLSHCILPPRVLHISRKLESNNWDSNLGTLIWEVGIPKKWHFDHYIKYLPLF